MTKGSKPCDDTCAWKAGTGGSPNQNGHHAIINEGIVLNCGRGRGSQLHFRRQDAAFSVSLTKLDSWKLFQTFWETCLGCYNSQVLSSTMPVSCKEAIHPPLQIGLPLSLVNHRRVTVERSNPFRNGN